MAKKPIEIICCDRCTDEIGRSDAVEAAPEGPAYYRQVKTAGQAAVDEKQLDHLCTKCKKAVEELDKRIFSDSRVRRLNGEAGEPAPTAGEGDPKQ